MSGIIQGISSVDNVIKEIRTDGDGKLQTGSTISQSIPDTNTAEELLALYGNFSGVAAGDFVTRKATSNGQVITALSISPLTAGTDSNISLNVPVKQPAALEVEASMSQRVRHNFATVALYENAVGGAVPVPANIQINTIYQSTAVQGAAYTAVAGTNLTIVLNAPFQGFFGDWIHVTGLVDNRLNYPNLAVNYISYDKRTICAGFSDEVILPSLAATYTPGAGTAFISHYNNMAGAKDGFGIRFSGNVSTSSSLVSIFGGNDVQVSGTLIGDNRVSVGTSNPIYTSGTSGNVEIRASTRYRLEGRPTECAFFDKLSDTIGAVYIPRLSRTSVKPSIQSNLRPRFRGYCPISMTRPVAKIVSSAKTGTTTATVTTDVPHGLVTGNWITIKGNRDQVAFANFATPAQVTVLTATTFTCVYGTAVTATTYGGSVILTNGGVDQQGLLPQVVQNAQVITGTGSAPDQLILTGNAAWTIGVGLLNVGDYMEVHGVRDNVTGANLGVDGTWEVANISTTFLTLIPVYNIFGVRVSPAVSTINTASGGSVIHRTTLRAHDIIVETWSENKMMIDGQGTARTDKAIPTYMVGGSIVTTQGTAAIPSPTTGLGGWYIHPTIVGLPDIASAAVTTTTTSAAIANNLGNGFQVNFAVTATSGTTPTLDLRVEESFDGGTNWVTLYEFQRVTANGSYNSPVLRSSGRHIRYVRTITGTTPSFTMALTRNILPFLPAEPQKRIVDRSIVLTTLNSVTPTLFSGTANNMQLVINIGAATTPPAIQLEGSEDNVNFYPIGTPLTAIASSTVQTTISQMSVTYLRARVSTVGVGVTMGYISLKAWS